MVDGESVLMRYAFINESMLLVNWEFQDDWTTYYLILERIPSE